MPALSRQTRRAKDGAPSVQVSTSLSVKNCYPIHTIEILGNAFDFLHRRNDFASVMKFIEEGFMGHLGILRDYRLSDNEAAGRTFGAQRLRIQ
jgi:hypothetical protein